MKFSLSSFHHISLPIIIIIIILLLLLRSRCAHNLRNSHKFAFLSRNFTSKHGRFRYPHLSSTVVSIRSLHTTCTCSCLSLPTSTTNHHTIPYHTNNPSSRVRQREKEEEEEEVKTSNSSILDFLGTSSRSLPVQNVYNLRCIALGISTPCQNDQHPSPPPRGNSNCFCTQESRTNH